ncbi:hypothetical protein QTP88_010202 [Uroleucon formosanum]
MACGDATRSTNEEEIRPELHSTQKKPYAAIMQYIRLPEFGPQPPVESTFLSNQ